MLYIRKEPPSPEVAQEISRVKRDVQWKQSGQPDSAYARTAFNLLDKSIIRKQLLREQHGLCAYCMRRIEEHENLSNMVIEHWMPIDADCRQALDYSNMMICCDGGRLNDDAQRVLHCDASKGNQILSISPYSKEQMEKIRYDRNGRIHTNPEDKELDKDINQILHLNEATDLVYGRRQTYSNFETFIKGLDKKGKTIGAAVRKKIEEITNATEYDEYAGVWLYLLKRKLRQTISL